MGIAPGAFDTPMLASLPRHIQESFDRELVFPRRFGNPREFAQLVRTIIENPMLNGDTIRIHGGSRMAVR
jgi:NAD(P)-dependent dehydrogenase (short-subunit alcohol dehydrogenase family)